jgi:hypothetical protein
MVVAAAHNDNPFIEAQRNQGMRERLFSCFDFKVSF